MIHLPAKRSGTSREAVEWNRMVDALAAMMPKQSVNTQTKITTRGTFRQSATGRRGGGAGDDNLVWI